MNINKILTKPKLKAWLESHKPMSFVGIRGNSTACPIFNFLKAKKLPVSSVAACAICFKKFEIAVFVDDLIEVKPKDWVNDFIWTVDSAASKNITAKRALQILKTV